MGVRTGQAPLSALITEQHGHRLPSLMPPDLTWGCHQPPRLPQKGGHLPGSCLSFLGSGPPRNFHAEHSLGGTASRLQVGFPTRRTLEGAQGSVVSWPKPGPTHQPTPGQGTRMGRLAKERERPTSLPRLLFPALNNHSRGGNLPEDTLSL